MDREQKELIGRCEACNLPLFAGDRGHRCSGWELLCYDHAPTYGDVLQQYEECLEDGDVPEPFDDMAKFKKAIAELETENPHEKSLVTL